MRRQQRFAGFTLVEVLMVVLLMSVLAAIVLPTMNPGIHDQLLSAAEVVASDLAYGRSLAVTNNDTYTFTFDLAHNQYSLQYSGSNSALSTLPASPYSSAQSTSTQLYTCLNNLPLLGGVVQLAAVGGTSSARTQVQFGSFGQTVQADETDIWLSAGSGAVQRYICVGVNPITGLATVKNFQSTPPPSSILTGS